MPDIRSAHITCQWRFHDKKTQRVKYKFDWQKNLHSQNTTGSGIVIRQLWALIVLKFVGAQLPITWPLWTFTEPTTCRGGYKKEEDYKHETSWPRILDTNHFQRPSQRNICTFVMCIKKATMCASTDTLLAKVHVTATICLVKCMCSTCIVKALIIYIKTTKHEFK